jgi:GDP-4-dehydro-6-deoxy-D-mannose reductase
VTRLPLVTGATGFAGTHLLAWLSSLGIRAHAWGHRATPAAGDGAIDWTAVDLLDRPAVRAALEAARPSAIYHCAGIADVHGAWLARAEALRVNAVGTHILLETARDLGLDGRVLSTGSALVYRQSLDPITEDHPIGPTTPYGVSKLAQELIAQGSPLDTLLTRPFNHAGPGQSPAYATSAFAQQIAEIEAGRRDPVLRVGNLDARRDITDVRDTVRAYHALVERGVVRRPYNVCSGRAYSMRALLDILLSLARVRVRVEIDPARLRPSDTPVVHGSHARLTADTGWEPLIPIEQTMSDLLDHWRARRDGAGS